MQSVNISKIIPARPKKVDMGKTVVHHLNTKSGILDLVTGTFVISKHFLSNFL